MTLKNLDKKDIAILRELDRNVRASYSQIGRKTRLSKEVVQYRIKKLEEKRIITGYWAITNTAPLQIYKILIKNRNLSGEQKKEFIEEFRKHKNVSWFAATEGNFDFIITVHAEHDKEIIAFSEDLLSRYGGFFQEKNLLRSGNAMITNEKYLYDDARLIYEYPFYYKEAIIPEDDTEYGIVTQLSLNARSTFTELGKRFNLTPEAIAHRFKKIIGRKLITGFKTRINVEALGLSYYHLFITLQDYSIKNKLLSYYKLHSAFNSYMEHIGCYDLHLEFILPSEDIQKVMDDFMLRFGDSVASYELLHIREEYVLSILK